MEFTDHTGKLAALEVRIAALEALNRRYAHAMEATDDGLWEWDLAANKIDFDSSFLRMLGYRYGELPGSLQTLRDYFVHPDDMASLEQVFAAAVANGEESLQLQCRLLPRTGEPIWVQVKAKFFDWDAQPGSARRPRRCVGMCTNITPFIAAQQALLEAKNQADAASRAKGEFLACVSHEIRTPMNAIIGVGYLMADTSLSEQQQSYLSSIHSAADSLLQILNQLLDFSKIESGQLILEQAHFDLELLFEKITRQFEISALHRRVTITFDIAPDVPRFLRGDASRLNQLLNHLLGNSFQHSGCDQVVLQVRRLTTEPLRLEFSVCDSGRGIAPAQLQAIRQRLSAGVPAVLAATHGLDICQQLVGLMQGQLQVESAPGQGCRVSFSADFETSRIGARVMLDQVRQLNNLRVLIVDDNTIARTIICTTARSLQLQVDEADKPLEALDKLRAADREGRPYHLVLLDYRMPTINGLQLTGMIKKDRNLGHRPLVFLISAYHRDEISSTDPNAVLVDEFLSKPVSESRLFDALSQAINRCDQLRELSPVQLAAGERAQLLQKARVLVVEDNIVNQQVLCGILKKQGVVTEVAANGEEAVQAIINSREAFDAVLMDLEMPVMDGLEATCAIRRQWCREQLPIIAVTAQAMRGDRDRCLAAGMNGYLSKPVNPEQLYAMLADALALVAQAQLSRR